MDKIDFVYSGTLLRLETSVIELFNRIVVGSQRIPLAWMGVDLRPTKKGDAVRVNVGYSNSDGAPFYDSNVISNGAFNFSIPTSEEPRLREFFDEAARRGGRAS